jgi:integrase
VADLAALLGESSGGPEPPPSPSHLCRTVRNVPTVLKARTHVALPAGTGAALTLGTALERYFTERTDAKPSRSQSRNSGRILLAAFGAGLKLAALSEERQRRFAQASVAKGYKLSYVARTMTVLKAAVAHAKLDLEVVYTEAQMRDRWGLSSAPRRRARIFSDADFAKLWSAALPSDLRRYLILQMATGGRPQTALDLSPAQRDRAPGLIDLNPPGRAQNKKYRPLLREPLALTGWLDAWEADRAGLARRSGRYCGYRNFDGVKSSLKRAAARAGIAPITTYSFRHKVATILRQARVTEDEIALWMGHRRPHLRMTFEYGEWDPGYLANALAALDAWFRRVDAMTETPLVCDGRAGPGPTVDNPPNLSEAD